MSRSFQPLWAVLIGLIACCMVAPNDAVAAPRNASNGLVERDCIRAIVGEASGEPYEGMVAVGEAIRNRGHLKGVYGLRATHSDREPKWVWDRATRAWEASRTSNLTKGATNWEAIETFGKPYWTKGMVKTAKVGSHSFYRRVR